MKSTKAMTIRLSADQARELQTVAEVDGLPVVEVIRAAISGHVGSRKQDDEFQRSLRDRIHRDQEMLQHFDR